jgi:hypothetical protein
MQALTLLWLRRWFRMPAVLACAALAAAACLPIEAGAVPAFARQTGQNCVACHAGGQFPELTPYGRLFKLTGYTIGERGIPFSLMGVATMNKTRSTSDPNGEVGSDFPKDGNPIFNTGSLFIAGKVTNNIGGFVQITYNNYDHQREDSSWQGHTYSDNLDIRYADRFIDGNRDLIVGVTLHNNPTVQDVWNSAPAWGFNVVPGSSGPGVTPLLAGGLAQQAAGLGAYAYWNRTLYAELSAYRTADGFWSFMSQGYRVATDNLAVQKGYSPYWRVALTHDWGPHNLMVGAAGLVADLHTDAADTSSPTWRYRDTALDAQYQYLLDPHTVTAQLSYIDERIGYDGATAGQAGAYDAANGTSAQPLTNDRDTLKMFRAKASYVYQARYGTSLSYFDVHGSYNSLNQAALPQDPSTWAQLASVSGSLAGTPDTRALTAEVFWTPVQYARIGLQYTAFNKYNGASSNYDGWGRSAKDNNTVFLYVWGAY